MIIATKLTCKSDAEVLWVVRDQIRFLGHVPTPGISLVEVKVPPGSGTPPHRHASPEIFYVLEGELQFANFGAGPPRLIDAAVGD
jgi:quercetin dioxygenase-like cupin family protein